MQRMPMPSARRLQVDCRILLRAEICGLSLEQAVTRSLKVLLREGQTSIPLGSLVDASLLAGNSRFCFRVS